jgi:hypothetical protein
MATWAWNTNNEVDAEVKRALLNYRPIFARYARTSVDLHDRSQLCSTCNTACSMSDITTSYRYREHITWTQTKRSFAEATSSTGCHLCIIIAHAFDKASIDEFAQMGPNETFKLRFEYRTAERDPSGKLDWEQRTRMSISNIILESHLPDEFWLRIRPEEPSRFKKLYIDLRMRPLKGENAHSSRSSRLTELSRFCYRARDGYSTEDSRLNREQAKSETSVYMAQSL